MKKIVMAVITILLMSNVVFAMPQRASDGIVYWNGDRNYPIWDAGNHGGSCIDVSSAVMKVNSKSECLIAVLDYSVNFDTDSMASKGVVQFREDKKTGQIFFYVEGSKWGWQKFGYSSHPEVYYLVKSHLMQR